MSAAETTRAARRYDFRQSEGLDRSSMRSLRSLCETFGHRASGTITGQLGTTVAVRFSALAQQPWADVLATMPDPTCVATAPLPPLPARAVVQLPLELATSWVELRLGGQLTTSLCRPLSDIERELLRPLVQALAADLAAAAAPHHELRPGPVSLLGSAQVQQALRGPDLCAAATFSVRFGDKHEWPLLLCFPLLLLRPLLEDVGSDSDGPEPPPFATMLDRLTDLPIDVAVRIGTVRLPAVALLDLAVGDVLRLPDRPGRPLRLMAGEQQFALVHPVNDHGRLAAVLAGADDPEGAAPVPLTALGGAPQPRQGQES